MVIIPDGKRSHERRDGVEGQKNESSRFQILFNNGQWSGLGRIVWYHLRREDQHHHLLPSSFFVLENLRAAVRVRPTTEKYL